MKPIAESRRALAILALVGLAACSGGGSGAPLAPIATGTAPTGTAPTGTVPTGTAAFEIFEAANAPGRRTPDYLSAGTKSLTILTDGANPQTVDLVQGAPNCSTVSGSLVCKVNFKAAAGRHVFTVTAYPLVDGKGAPLSTNSTPPVVVVAGQQKLSKLILDGIPASVSLALANATPSGAAKIPLAVVVSDAAGYTIIGNAPFAAPIALRSSDAKDAPTNKTSLASPADTNGVAVLYDGAKVASVSFFAKGTNVASNTVVMAPAIVAPPTATPTVAPTATPTMKPTATPTAKPTAEPTAKPTAVPTAKPTIKPTATPTAAPTAKPTAKPTPVPTGVPTAAPTPIAIKTPLTAGQVIVGDGFSDVSPHQLVRTSSNVMYVSTPTCNGYPNCYGNRLPMYVSTHPGTATGFFEADAAHHPQAGAGDNVGTSALAIDGNGTIWVAYNTRGEGSFVTTFDTHKNLWGKATQLSGPSGPLTQGREGTAIAVDASGTPHVIWSFEAQGHKHIGYSAHLGGAWTPRVQIDDTPLTGRLYNLHPTMAFAPDGTLLVSWITGDEITQYNNPDGKVHVRAMRGGSWMPSVQVLDQNYQAHAGYAQTTIDQGPSMMVTSDGTAHLTYVDDTDTIRYWYSSDYTTWKGDRQPPAQRTHDPSLGPDGSGGVYIYGHGTPIGTFAGHGDNIDRMHLPAGATHWGPFEQVVSDDNVDCSVSTRWSQFFHYFPSEIDYLYWNDHKPDFDLVGQH